MNYLQHKLSSNNFGMSYSFSKCTLIIYTLQLRNLASRVSLHMWLVSLRFISESHPDCALSLPLSFFLSFAFLYFYGYDHFSFDCINTRPSPHFHLKSRNNVWCIWPESSLKLGTICFINAIWTICSHVYVWSYRRLPCISLMRVIFALAMHFLYVRNNIKTSNTV